MKKILKKIVEIVTLSLSKRIIQKYKPTVIAVTGSVGKTSTKDAVFLMLKDLTKVRKSRDSLNSELGLPLAIADFKGGVNTSSVFWIKAILKLLKILFTNFRFPEILVLEMGADQPGDLDKLLKVAPPDIGIITSVRKSHLKNFKNPSQIIKEKRKLVEAIKEEGLAVLCGDDENVLKMTGKIKAKIVTYGFTKDNLIKAKNIKFDCEVKDIDKKIKCSSNFKLYSNNNFIPVRLENVLGKSQVYACLAASAVGFHYDYNLIQIADILKKYKSPKGRLNVLKGIEKSLIIDDTYNASTPLSVYVALDVLKNVKAKKRIAVLGDMLELGSQEIKSHKKIGKKIFDYADIVFTYGQAAKHITTEAKKNKKLKNKLAEHFTSRRKLIKTLKDLIDKEMAVLVKGSQGMRMEKITKEILFNKKQAKNLLVRQSKEWLKK
ncbi:MAG: hypothetical protein GF347_03460 [Candidatus Moranbacteria bacterium]|nr:hypothetical protein [Candidatus Moranbacteria bacterium]